MWRKRSAASFTAATTFGWPYPVDDDRDAGHEVEEAVAVHVLHHDALPARDDQRVLLDVAGGGPRLVALDDRAGLRARGRHDDLGIVSALRLRSVLTQVMPLRGVGCDSITVRLCSRVNCAT